jgi:hypothetical protein
VIVDQQGAPHSFAVLKTEEVAVESVRQLSCATAGIEGVGRTVEPRAMLPDEVFPGAFVTVSACGRQRKILEVQRRCLADDLAPVRLDSTKRTIQAGFEYRPKARDIQSPSFGLALEVQAPQFGVSEA